MVQRRGSFLYIRQGTVINKTNVTGRADENPHQLLLSLLFAQIITFWFALASKGVFYKVLSENVNAEIYLDLLQSSFIPFLQERGEIEDALLMQDGTRPRTANTVLDYLLEISNFKSLPKS